MYCEYYGLVRTPFEMTPDPAFLYLGETHREGLATLVYGVQSGKGFVVLTGEVGTGKTTLLHALLGQLDANTSSAFIFNPKLDTLDFFRVLFDEFGIEKTCRTKASLPAGKPWRRTCRIPLAWAPFRPAPMGGSAVGM